jgi:hypothetical protein
MRNCILGLNYLGDGLKTLQDHDHSRCFFEESRTGRRDGRKNPARNTKPFIKDKISYNKISLHNREKGT